MTAKLVIGLAFSLALTTAAAATPILKSEVEVTATIVTVGDMFKDAGLRAEEPMFRAPAPGTSGIVPVEAVRQAAAQAGIDSFDAEGVLRVRVTRRATAVGEPMLASRIVDDLKTRGFIGEGVTASVTFDQRQLQFNAEAVPEALTLGALRYMPQGGAFAARFVLAGIDAPVDLSGHIELMVDAPHLASSLRAGDVIRATDIEMRPVPLRYAESAGYAELDQVVGKAMVRQTRSGQPIRMADVTEPQVIARNDDVTIYFRNGPLLLTVKGKALDGAAEGELVQVLNLMSRKALTAIAMGPGAVSISAPSTEIAGL